MYFLQFSFIDKLGNATVIKFTFKVQKEMKIY